MFCEREVADSSNWLKIHLWAGFAVFHWSCFAEFFKHGDEAKGFGIITKRIGAP
jgi:hypothetical protein